MISARITSKMYRAASLACVSLCVVGIVANAGAANDNDFESTTKCCTGAADPKLPLAMPHFLDVMDRTDGDPPLATTTSKRSHARQTHDLNAASSVYRETADDGEYRDPAISGRHAHPQNWHAGGVARQPRRAHELTNQPKPVWEPAVHTPSSNYNDNRKTRGEKEREREGAEVYQRQRNHFKSRFAEQRPPRPYNNDKHQRVTGGDDDDPEDGEDEDDEDDEDDKEFVPMRMYAQVRQYESESHLPSSDEEPSLRKIVKDSRIHTVYMEEGYEDGAYDHAGEEKHAEEEEARVEHRRKKRHIDAAITNVEIDTDFIGKNRYALGEPDNSADRKYPYYDKKTINAHSPLRYAQTIDDIPRKRDGNMAFYDDSHARTKCDEVVDTVAPIPKDLDAGEEAPEKTMIPKLPRLKQLGDKIDCFKVKFFGEQPLDNPLFNEETVGSLTTLFNEPEFTETASLFRLTTRTGKTFQPIAVGESGYPASGKLSDEDEENANENANSKVASTDADERVTVDGAFQPLPEAEALHTRITRRRQRPHHLNKSHSGRHAAYRPTRGTTAPPLPSSPNVISEVYYKDQIKPSEQLNVFADVINHIQNMSRKAYTSASEQRPRVVAATSSLSMSRPAAINTKPPTGHRKKLKTKYPVMKSTQQLYTDYMRRSKNGPSRVQNDFSPIAQESNLNVGTVQIPKSYDAPDPLPTPKGNAEPVQYSTLDVPLNKYLVPGMKPPLAIEKPLIYSDYQSDGVLKRREWLSHHRLARRKRATRNYSEIRRQPASRPQEPEEDDDTDDYVPHRPTNYHYDPDTDRIVYDKKPTTEKSVEEMIEEYFEEEPEEPKVVTTKKPPAPHKTVYHKDVLNKANGKTLVDFLAILKSDPSYKPIEDSKPTKEPSTTTLTPESTTPPEFLKFLAKLHSSEGYKRIDNPEDVPAAKKKPKTTTTEAPVEEEETEEEPVQAGSVQNSPGGQFGQDDGLQIFDINDYLPKVKTYTPRTSIDYSKYKTIERTTSRHTLSSRYSEEDGEPFERRSQTEAPASTKYQTAPPRLRPITPEKNDDDEERPNLTAGTQANDDESDEENAPSTTAKSTTTTSAPKIRVRGRHKPSRRPTRATSPKPQTATGEAKADDTTSEAVENYTPATHRPPSRVYPRRHRPKIRLRSTTPTSSPTSDDDNDEDPSETRRRTIRRQSNAVPANHKPDYTPVTISKRMDDYPTMLVQRQARLVTPEIINYNQTADASASRSGEINPRRSAARYKVARVATHAASTSHDRDASKGQINNSAFDSPRGNGNIDRSDVIDVAAGVKFIKDPNKRLYFYAPL